jgi:hypothetical protein
MDTSSVVSPMLVVTSILADSSVPGSIVANKYFIAQFCTVTEANGKCALDSVYVGAWTAVQSVGQIIGKSLAYSQTVLSSPDEQEC